MIDLRFNFNEIRHVEFGLGKDADNDQIFRTVPIGDRAQTELQRIASNTWSEMRGSVAGQPTQTEFQPIMDIDQISSFVPISDDQTMRSRLEGGPNTYEIAEKYAGTEYVYLPVGDDKVAVLRDLHNAHLDMTTDVFDDVATIFSYFARMWDQDGNRLTAIKRATSFKGLAQKGNLLSMSANVLDIIDDNIFKLDSSFDILVDDEHVHIWRANSFEAIGQLRENILASVGDNVDIIKEHMDFVDFGPIGQFASQHINGARYLASIRSQLTPDRINKISLIKLCNDTGVRVSEQDGLIIVEPNHIIGFLEVLDRRRYGIELVDGKLEQFRASSRQRLNR